MARIGWSVAASTFSGSPQAYHVELTTSDVNVVSRISSKGSSVLFTHLQPNTRYQVRVQAENAAGNGSSSSFVAFKTKPSECWNNCMHELFRQGRTLNNFPTIGKNINKRDWKSRHSKEHLEMWREDRRTNRRLFNCWIYHFVRRKKVWQLSIVIGNSLIDVLLGFMTFHGRKGDPYSFQDPSFSFRQTPSVIIIRCEVTRLPFKV